MKPISHFLLVTASVCLLTHSAFADAKDDIAAAMKAQNDAPAFRAKLSTTDNNTKAVTSVTMECVNPDQIHVKTEMGGQTAVEMYSDGKKTVMSQGGGNFQDAPPQVGEMLTQNRKQMMMNDALKSAKDVKVAGKESVNGNPATVYTYTSDMMGLTSANKLWVSDKDHRPVKSEGDVKGEISGQKMDMKVTAAFDYDPSIKIVLPAAK